MRRPMPEGRQVCGRTSPRFRDARSADQRADDSRSDGAVQLGQALDIGGLDTTGAGRGRFGRPFVDVHRELLSERVRSVALSTARRRARRGSGRASAPTGRATSVPGSRLDEPVAGIGRHGANGVDHDDLCTGGTGLFRMVGQRWRLVSLVLVPHRMMSFEWRLSIGVEALGAAKGHLLRRHRTVGPQIDRCTRAVRTGFLDSRSGKPMASRLWLSESPYGMIAPAPSRSMILADLSG